MLGKAPVAFCFDKFHWEFVRIFLMQLMILEQNL